MKVLAKKKVVRIDRSPLNPRVWCLELSCGHDFYTTATQKPRRKENICEKCLGKVK